MRLHDKAMPIPRPKSCISLWIFAMRHVVWAVVVARFRSGRLSQKWSLRWACNWKEYGYALDGLRFTSFLNRLNKTLFVIKLGCGAQLGPMPEMAVLCRSGVWIWQALLVLQWVFLITLKNDVFPGSSDWNATLLAWIALEGSGCHRF